MTKVWQQTFTLEQLTARGEGTLAELVGIVFTGVGDDWLRAAMPVDARTRQPFGRLHGGASVVLAETVASIAASMALPEGKGAVGMEINANHVRPAVSGHVHATARAEAIGRTTQVWAIRIEDDAGKLICVSRMTAAVIDGDGQA